MYQFWKFIFVLQFLPSYCTVYYDDENTVDEMLDESEKDDDSFQMLVHGGYHYDHPYFDKYVVSIRTRSPTEFFGDNHYCAGTVIGLRMVVTAAHCVMDSSRIKMRSHRLVVVAATPNRLHHTAKTKIVHVNRVIVHPQFKRKSVHDIALLMLDKELPLENTSMRIMTLPNARPAFNTTCLVAGWGRLFKNGPYAAKIVYAVLNIERPEVCKRFYGEFYHPEFQLCAWSLQRDQRDVCRGDTGGPLVCHSQLSGIISWAVACGEEEFPIIFTDVFSHYDWLFNTANTADRKFSFRIVHLTHAFVFFRIIMILKT